MNYLDDECFTSISEKGLLNDIASLATVRGASLEVVGTDTGWKLTLSSAKGAVYLEKFCAEIVISSTESKNTQTYPSDVDNAVCAAIDLLKIVARIRG